MVEIIKRLIRRYRVRSLREKCLRVIDGERIDMLKERLNGLPQEVAYWLTEREVQESLPNLRCCELARKKFRTGDDFVEALNALHVNPDQIRVLVEKARHVGGAIKYLEYRKYLEMNVARVVALGLDRGKSRRVLDLGCGAGFFLFALRLCGHDGIGIDRKENADGFDVEGPDIFTEIRNIQKVNYLHHIIKPKNPVPADLGEFDLITGFDCWFDGEYSVGRVYTPWDSAQWRQFLIQISRCLRRGGCLHLEVNDKWEYSEGYIYPGDTSALIPFENFEGGISNRTMSLIRR